MHFRASDYIDSISETDFDENEKIRDIPASAVEDRENKGTGAVNNKTSQPIFPASPLLTHLPLMTAGGNSLG